MLDRCGRLLRLILWIDTRPTPASLVGTACPGRHRVPKLQYLLQYETLKHRLLYIYLGINRRYKTA